MILPKEEYEKTVKRPYPPLLGSLVLNGITDESVYAGFFSVPYARRDSLLCDGIWYNNAAAEDLGRRLIETEWNNDAAIYKLSTVLRSREKELLDSVQMSFEIFAEKFTNYMASLALVYLAEQPFFNKLKLLFCCVYQQRRPRRYSMF